MIRLFSIRELENFSGIKAHTIRIWEQRYEVFIPERSMGQIRSYTLTDVQRLLKLAFLVKRGHKISKLVHASLHDLEHVIQKWTDEESVLETTLHHLIVSLYLDIEKFEAIWSRALSNWDIHQATESLLLPLLQKTCLLRSRGKHPELYFALASVRNKLALAIENARSEKLTAKKALLFLPEGERFELALLYMHYILARKGIRVFYLGCETPLTVLRAMAEEKQPDFFVSYVSCKKRFKLSETADYLKRYFPKMKILAGIDDDATTEERDHLACFHYSLIESVLSESTAVDYTFVFERHRN